jgi:hypothetical protein
MQRAIATFAVWGAGLCAHGATARAADADLCKGKVPGTVTFYDKEISRDTPLPAPATKLQFGKPMYALACLTDPVGPQEGGGEKFRVVLNVKQVNLPAGKYTSYKDSKQEGVLRPELSKPRKDIIIFLHEDFPFDSLAAKLDPGEYEFRLQAATEKGTGKLDLTIQVTQDTATGYIQELRKAGYVADGKVLVKKS